MLFEDLVLRGKTTPLHTHPHEESFYVIEGEIRIHVDGAEHDLRRAGSPSYPARRRMPSS